MLLLRILRRKDLWRRPHFRRMLGVDTAMKLLVVVAVGLLLFTALEVLSV